MDGVYLTCPDLATAPDNVVATAFHLIEDELQASGRGPGSVEHRRFYAFALLLRHADEVREQALRILRALRRCTEPAGLSESDVADLVTQAFADDCPDFSLLIRAILG